ATVARPGPHDYSPSRGAWEGRGRALRGTSTSGAACCPRSERSPSHDVPCPPERPPPTWKPGIGRSSEATVLLEGGLAVLTIDADAHVVETERTWDYLAPEDRKYRPVIVGQLDGKGRREYWMVDGRIRGFRFRTLSEKQMVELSERTGRDVVTPQASREMD